MQRNNTLFSDVEREKYKSNLLYFRAEELTQGTFIKITNLYLEFKHHLTKSLPLTYTKKSLYIEYIPKNKHKNIIKLNKIKTPALIKNKGYFFNRLLSSL